MGSGTKRNSCQRDVAGRRKRVHSWNYRRADFKLRFLRVKAADPIKTASLPGRSCYNGKTFRVSDRGRRHVDGMWIRPLSLTFVHHHPLRPCTKRKFKFCIVDVLRIARSRAPLCARSAIMLGYYHRFRSLSSQDNLFDCLDFCYQRVVKGIEREIVWETLVWGRVCKI